MNMIFSRPKKGKRINPPFSIHCVTFYLAYFPLLSNKKQKDRLSG